MPLKGHFFVWVNPTKKLANIFKAWVNYNC